MLISSCYLISNSLSLILNFVLHLISLMCLGLIETLGSYISKTSKHYDREDSSSPNTDVSSLTECLIQLLSLLKALLDRVTIYVKQTLQVWALLFLLYYLIKFQC